MPDQDGYSVCSHIKQSPQYAKNSSNLDVRRDEQERGGSRGGSASRRTGAKPFQPQELIGRVKNLLGSRKSTPPAEQRKIIQQRCHRLVACSQPQPSLLGSSTTCPGHPVPTQLLQSPSLPKEKASGRALWQKLFAAKPGERNSRARAASRRHRTPRTACQDNGDSHKLRAEIAQIGSAHQEAADGITD